LIRTIGVDFTEKYSKLRYGIIFNVTKVILCGTKYLGFKSYSCPTCDHGKSVAFSCKGRFCSRCGKKQTDQWISKASNVLPKTRWQHITFTMPNSLWPIFWLNRNLFGLISAIAAGINDAPRSRATRYLAEFLILEIKSRLSSAKQASGN
jgi:hypothetical protein